MTIDEFRRRMESFRHAAEARALKDSYLALDRLHAMYNDLDANEQSTADQRLIGDLARGA